MGWSLVAGAGIAGLLVATPLARATDDSKKESTTSSQTQSGSTGASGTSSTGTGSSASTAAPSHKNELTGKIQKYDRDSKTITLDSSDKKLKLGDSSQVMKDGAKASAGDLREGDEVRASFAEAPTGAFEIVVIEVMPAGAGSGSTGMTPGTSGAEKSSTQSGSAGEKSSGSTEKKP